jgi:excisionase family DNA binding protein
MTREPLSPEELRGRVVITVAEYAATFCADERTVRRAIRDGQIQGLQVGDTWRIPVAPLLRQCGLENSEAADTTPRPIAIAEPTGKIGHFDDSG